MVNAGVNVRLDDDITGFGELWFEHKEFPVFFKYSEILTVKRMYGMFLLLPFKTFSGKTVVLGPANDVNPRQHNF